MRCFNLSCLPILGINQAGYSLTLLLAMTLMPTTMTSCGSSSSQSEPPVNDIQQDAALTDDSDLALASVAPINSKELEVLIGKLDRPKPFFGANPVGRLLKASGVNLGSGTCSEDAYILDKIEVVKGEVHLLLITDRSNCFKQDLESRGMTVLKSQVKRQMKVILSCSDSKVEQLSGKSISGLLRSGKIADLDCSAAPFARAGIFIALLQQIEIQAEKNSRTVYTVSSKEKTVVSSESGFCTAQFESGVWTYEACRYRESMQHNEVNSIAGANSRYGYAYEIDFSRQRNVHGVERFLTSTEAAPFKFVNWAGFIRFPESQAPTFQLSTGEGSNYLEKFGTFY